MTYGRKTHHPVSYLVYQVLLWDLDDVLLHSVAVALVGHLLGHQLFQDKQQELVVVSPESQVACKCLVENRYQSVQPKTNKRKERSRFGWRREDSGISKLITWAYDKYCFFFFKELKN